MAKCVSVLMLLVMSFSVFARECDRILDSNAANNCDECIRCGGNWCNEIGRRYKHCTSEPADNWCPAARETFAKFDDASEKGSIFDPQYVRARAFVGGKLTTDINILRPPPVKGKLQAYTRLISTTQYIKDNSTIKVAMRTNRLMVVTTDLKDDFCLPNSTRTEFIRVKVGLIGQPEEVTLEYEVPCACGCSERIERNSSQCSHFGDLSCGVCNCREGRTGDRCERKKCTDRGDTPPTCYSSSKPDVICSGNGRCDHECNVCECFDDVNIEGSQYFHPNSHCEDICSVTNKCGDCLHNPEPGPCDSCGMADTSVYIQNINESLLDERQGGRKVWVLCNVTLADCGLVRYAAMEKDGVHVMVISACDGSNEYLGAGARPITVPIVACVAAAVVALAAAGGYAAWRSRLAPLQPLDPQYANIGGEDCVGVNPLYVDPTSSFKNPMYGKGT